MLEPLCAPFRENFWISMYVTGSLVMSPGVMILGWRKVDLRNYILLIG